MTTETNRYQQGKVYKIYRDDCLDIYIGSTTAPTLSRRLSEHVSGYKRGKGVTSCQLVNRPGYYITLLESYPCNNRDELRAREQHYIDTLENVINIQKAYTGLTKQEYMQQHAKQWYAENKERVQAYRKEHYQQNKEHAAKLARQYVSNNKERTLAYRKQYYEENKEQILDRNRQYAARTTEQKKVTSQAYYERNKERLIARSLQKVTCECGCIVACAAISTHRKTQKHQKLMAAQTTPL